VSAGIVGVDACPTGWVGVILDGGSTRAIWAATIDELAVQAGGRAVLAIDIPIGLPEHGVRAADGAARKAAGPRGAAVFTTPVRAALEASTFKEANAVSRDLAGSGLSQQSYGLRTKILEVDRWLNTVACDVREVHPEVSFAVMAGEPLATKKKSWAGACERRRLLADAGIVLDDDLGVAGIKAGYDDVLDAAVAAWTAQRIVAGTAISLPSPPEVDSAGRLVAIWA